MIKREHLYYEEFYQTIKQSHMKRVKKINETGLRGNVQLFLLLFVFFSGCMSARQAGVVESSDRGYYRSHTNSQVVRDDIKDGFESIIRIQNNVIYRTYQFYLDEMPLESEVRGQDLEEISADSYLDDQSTAGTAIVVSEFRDKYTLLTAAHTVFFPDTIWHYHETPSETDDQRVEAISIRQSVNHFLIMDRGIISLDFVVNDPHRDLAVMTNSETDSDNLLRPLSLSLGNSDRLDWGDMIYALGYPKGAKMVTLGTVSRSDHPTRSILIDASFNRGFSGGAIFAIRNDGSGMEWMGVVTSALGENETFLAPDGVETEDFNPDIPYRGDVFVRSTPRINYGITNAVGINEIQEFFEEYEDELNDAGVIIPQQNR